MIPSCISNEDFLMQNKSLLRFFVSLMASGLLITCSLAYTLSTNGLSGRREILHVVRPMTRLHSTPPFLSPFPSSSTSSTDHERYMMEAFDNRVGPFPNTFSSNSSSSQRVTLTRYLSGLVQDQPEVCIVRS